MDNIWISGIFLFWQNHLTPCLLWLVWRIWSYRKLVWRRMQLLAFVDSGKISYMYWFSLLLCIFHVLDLYFSCVGLVFGVLDLYFGALDLYWVSVYYRVGEPSLGKRFYSLRCADLCLLDHMVYHQSHEISDGERFEMFTTPLKVEIGTIGNIGNKLIWDQIGIFQSNWLYIIFINGFGVDWGWNTNRFGSGKQTINWNLSKYIDSLIYLLIFQFLNGSITLGTRPGEAPLINRILYL